jgi:hypothetical protein
MPDWEKSVMANQLGPIEVCCDSPPYPIIQACVQIGIQSPEDVRWCRMSHHVDQHAGQRGILHLLPWKMLWGADPAERTCVCGRKLPELAGYGFTLLSGKEVFYLLGQCDRCRTVFWEETEPRATV